MEQLYIVYDESDFPVRIGNIEEIERFTGMKRASIYSQISHAKSGKRYRKRMIYRVSDLEDSDDES